MDQHESQIVMNLAEAVREFQEQCTGHTPKSVSVVLSEDTLVITLHEALTLAEKAVATTEAGAEQVQEFHRRLFAASFPSLRKEIQRISGREVREGTAEAEPGTGAIAHAFTTGTMVQVFLLKPVSSETGEV